MTYKRRLVLVLLTFSICTAFLRAQNDKKGEPEIAPPSSALQGDLNMLLAQLPNARIALGLKQPEGAGEPQHILITADDIVCAGVYNLKSKVPVLFLCGKVPQLPINLQIAAVAYALAEMLIQQNPQLKAGTSDYQDLDRVALAIWAGHGQDFAELLQTKRNLDMQVPSAPSKPVQAQKFNPEIGKALGTILQAGEMGVTQAYYSGNTAALNAIAQRHPELKPDVDVLEANPLSGGPAPFQTQPTNIKTVPRMQGGQNMPAGGIPADLMSDIEPRVILLNAGGKGH